MDEIEELLKKPREEWKKMLDGGQRELLAPPSKNTCAILNWIWLGRGDRGTGRDI
jgi:hypothetical protein